MEICLGRMPVIKNALGYQGKFVKATSEAQQCGVFDTLDRWQKDGAGRYQSLPSLGWLTAQLPPLTSNLGLADIADVYSVLSALHSKGRNPQPAACLHQGFYYLMADTPPQAKEASEDQLQDQDSSPSAPRREPVIPVGSKYQGLTMQLLASLFQLASEGPPASHLLLATVDDDGSVSFMRCFAGVQPPFEGPGALPDAMGVEMHDSEDDDG